MTYRVVYRAKDKKTGKPCNRIEEVTYRVVYRAKDKKTGNHVK